MRRQDFGSQLLDLRNLPRRAFSLVMRMSNGVRSRL